jgi:hypothetical protein
MAEPTLPQAAIEAAQKSVRAGYGVMADALAGQIRYALEAAAPLIRADERARIYAQLGNDHYVIFTEDRFTVEHSVECKLSGHMHECAVHAAVAAVADEMDGPDPELLGRWRITGISEGLPDLERAEREQT